MLELVYDHEHGIAWQPNPKPFEYGQAYWDEYMRRRGTQIACALNRARMELCSGLGPRLWDIGIGSGEFICAWESRYAENSAVGWDINPVAVAWLRERGRLFTPRQLAETDSYMLDLVTMWDCLEHLPDPASFLAVLKPFCYLCLSLPIFDSLSQIKMSRHYKPREHLWHFTRAGLIWYLGVYGFDLVEYNDAETRAGREQIESFVFKKE